MSYQVKNTQAKWYIELSNGFHSLMGRLGIPEDLSSEIKSFMLDVARSQFMAGNKSGIRWAREKNLGPAPAAAGAA